MPNPLSPSNPVLYSDVEVRRPQDRALAVNAEAVLNSVDNIFSIYERERLFRYTGNNLRTLLFNLLIVDPLKNDSVVFLVQTNIARSLSRDPRIIFRVGDILVVPDPGSRTVSVDFSFSIKGLEGNIFRRFYDYPVASLWSSSRNSEVF